MNDDPKKPSGPDYITTKQLPAMTDRALLEDLTRTVKDGFANQNTQLLDFGERLVSLEEADREMDRRLHEFEGRLMRNSSRVKRVSDSDLTQESKLADVIVWRDTIERVLTETAAKVGTIEAKTAAQDKVLSEQTALLKQNNAWTEEMRNAARSALNNKYVRGLLIALVVFVTQFIARHT